VSVVASVAINVDSRDAAAKLRQFQQQSTAAGRAAEQLQQGTTAAGQAAQSAGRQFQTAANGLKYYIDATGRARKENEQFVSTAEAAAAGLKLQARAGDEAGRSMSKLEGIMKQLGLAVGAAGVGRFAAGLTRTAATFEGELRKAAAIEGGGNFNQLRQDVERVAAAAAGTPTQVAALATSLSRAGFTAAETGQSLQGIVRGAEATGLSFEQMGSIVSDSMRSFGIETAKTESVVDILVKTANSSNQTVQDLGESLKYAAPIARSLGVNITDLSATMAILANNGIRGSEAGTALRTGLAKLQLAASASNGELLDLLSGNKQLADSMKALGVSVTDASGKLKPLDDVLINLKRGLEGLGPGVQAEVLQALFGEEAGGKLRAALNSTEEEIRKMFGTIRAGAGAAAETQKEMQGFSYSMEVLGGNVEIVSNAIGDKFIAVLQPMVNGLNAALSEAQKLPKPLRDVAAGAAAVGIAVAGVTLAVKTLIPVVTTLAGLMGIGGLGGLIAAGPWIALAAGIAAVVGAFASAAQEAERFNNVIASGTTEQLSQEMARLENAIAAAESKTAGYQNELRGVGNQSGYASLEVKKLKAQLDQLQGTYNVRIQVEEIFTGGKGGKNVPQGYRLINGRLAYQVPGVGWVYADTGEPAQETAPPTTPPRGGGGGGAASAKRGGADKAASEAARLQSRLRGLQIETQGTLQLALIKGKIAEAEMAGNKELAIQLQGEQRRQQILLELQRSLEGVTDEREKQALLTKAQAELESAGMDTAAEMERLMQDRTKSVQDVINGLEFEQVKILAVTDAQKQAIQFLEIENQLKSQGITLSDAQAAAIRRIIAEIANLTKAQQEAQAKLQMEKDLYQGIADAVAGTFSNTIDAAVKGTESLGEALKGLGADLLQTIGKMLIMYGIAQGLGALGGGAGNPQGIFSFLARGFGFRGAKDGAYWPGGFEAFADGGVVNRPTMGLIGEGGEPEYIIPASKMRSAMARYAGGIRGSGVIDGAVSDNRDFLNSLTTGINGSTVDVSESQDAAAATRASLRETERLRENRMQIMSQQSASERRYERERIEQMASTPGNLNIRYESQVINNVEYVTRDQAERMAAQSALRGRELAIGALQNSVKTRKRVGI